MTQANQTKNIFGFSCFEEDELQFQKTATFFTPSETFQENSFSTQSQFSDEGKENSNASTPEQKIRVKVKGKIHTFEVNSSIKKKGRRATESANLQEKIMETINKPPQINKSEEIKTLKQEQGLPKVVSKIFQVKERKRQSKENNENKLNSTFDPSNYIFADMSFENENNVNITFNGSDETVQAQPEESNKSLIQSKDTFVIKKPAKNKLIIANLNNNKASLNTIINTHSLPQSTKNISSIPDQTLPVIIPTKLKPLSISIDDHSNFSGPNMKHSYFQNPQTFKFEEKVKEKLYGLGTIGNPLMYPKTTTNASNVIFSKGQNFVFTYNGQKHILKGSVKPANMNTQTKAFKFRDITTEESLPSISTSLELRSIAQKNEITTILQSRKQPSSEVLDLSNSYRRPNSTRFKPQEAILEKIFNPVGSTKGQSRINYLKKREYNSTQISNY